MDFTIAFLRVFLNDLVYASPVLLSLLALICVFGVIIGKIEGWSMSDSLYHAFINATTVGYGDFRPAKGRAKFLAVVLAFIGLIFTGMVVAVALHAANDAFDLVYGVGSFTDR